MIIQEGDVSFKGSNISSLPNLERNNKSKHSSYANLEGQTRLKWVNYLHYLDIIEKMDATISNLTMNKHII